MVIRTGGFWRNLLNTFPICWSATGSHHWRGSLCDKGDVVFSRLRKLRWVAVFNCAVNVEEFRWVERVGSWSWGAARKQNHVQRRIWKIILYSFFQILKNYSPVWKPASFSSGKLFWRMYPQEFMPPLWRIVLSIHSINIETLVYVSCRSTCKTKQNVTPFHFYRHNCLAPEPI